MNTKRQLPTHEVYLCFHLRTERMTPGCIERLKAFGVENLEDGETFKAYGIVSDPDKIVEELSQFPEIVVIERAEPPSSK